MPRTKLQICMAIAILGLIAAYGLYCNLVEVTTGCTGGIIALGMKLLEHIPTTPTTPSTTG